MGSTRKRPKPHLTRRRLHSGALKVFLGATVTRAAVFPGCGAEQAVPENATASKPSQPDSRDKRRPNVLLVTIDTVRADRVGPAGFSAARTPTLDRLARQGVYADAYVQQPQTTPNHATILSGTYVQTHGLRTTLWEKVRADVPTIDQLFKRAGYRTAALLSWYSFDDHFTALKRDWETWQLLIVRPGTHEAVTPEQARELLNAGAHMDTSIDGDAHVTTDAAIRWLDEHGKTPEQPWFLWLHYRDPHYPYTPPPPHTIPTDGGSSFDGSYASIGKVSGGYQPTAQDMSRLLAAYDGEIAYTDSQLSRLVQHLEQRKLADDTILVVTADHGEAFLEHGDWLHGNALYQSNVHVPLIVRFPAGKSAVTPGHRIDAPIQSADIAPTLLDLCGVPQPGAMEGRSFASLLAGGNEPGRPRGAWGTLSDGSQQYTVEGSWKLIRRVGGSDELYDIKGDPGETRNLIGEAPEPATRLRLALDAW
ncbi:MAG TPA: sulfatase, partial [Chloroflexota bacterium]|nr:sulfatase [Chloroflexota bacterium]